MKVYIVTELYYDVNDDFYRNRSGIEYFLNNGQKVIIVDVKYLVNPKSNFLTNNIDINNNNLSLEIVKKLEQIESILKEDKSISIAFINLSCSSKAVKIARIFRKYGVKIGTTHLSIIPHPNNALNAVNILFNIFTKYKITKFFNILIDKFYCKFLDIESYDFSIVASNKLKNIGGVKAKETNIIEAHSCDYDICLNTRDERLIQEKYVVFVDQYLLNHPDFIRSGVNLGISKEKYLYELNSYFDSIEQSFGFIVVIAAHPKASLDSYKEDFNDRPIFFNQTCQLIKDSEFMMTHHSSAISFAVVYGKSIIFLVSDEIIRSEIFNELKFLSKSVMQPIVNVSSPYAMLKIPKIDNIVYSKYMDRYINNNNKKKSIWEIFESEYLQKLKTKHSRFP